MGWSADVLVAVRGPVRDVDLFRHRFRRFWEAWDEWGVTCKRAWMRVRPAKHRRSQHTSPPEWWWLEPPEKDSEQGQQAENQASEVVAARCSPESLVALAARQCGAVAPTRRLVADLLRLPEELRAIVLAEGLSASQLAGLQRWLGCTPEGDKRGDGEGVQCGKSMKRAELAMMVERFVTEELEAELVYQANLLKETLEHAVISLLPSFTRLTVALIAMPECWVTEPIGRVYAAGELLIDSPPFEITDLLLADTFHLDDKRDMRGDSDNGEWTSFAFDVLDYDHEFEWGLAEPCACDECAEARRLGLLGHEEGTSLGTYKNAERVWSSAAARSGQQD